MPECTYVAITILSTSIGADARKAKLNVGLQHPDGLAQQMDRKQAAQEVSAQEQPLRKLSARPLAILEAKRLIHARPQILHERPPSVFHPDMASAKASRKVRTDPTCTTSLATSAEKHGDS